MSFISYAQNGEDVILWRSLRQIENGFYIDVGACDPDVDSVTRAFYERGWSGINVEPSREYFERCVARRPRDTNLNMAVTAIPGQVRFLNIAGTGLSTTVDDVAELASAQGREIETRQVRGVTLADICAMAGGADIHFLKIDVEGAELAVLQGADFRRFRPWVVVVEATLPGTTERSEHSWEPLLLQAGYDRCLFDGLNLYYLAQERAELGRFMTAGANVLDDYVPALVDDLQRQQAAAQVVIETLQEQLAAAQAWGQGLEASAHERDAMLAAEHEATAAANANVAKMQAALLAAEEARQKAADEAETRFATIQQALEEAHAAQAALREQAEAAQAALQTKLARLKDALASEEARHDALKARHKDIEAARAQDLEAARLVTQRLQRLAAASGLEMPNLPGTEDDTLPERLAEHIAWRAHESAWWRAAHEEVAKRLDMLLGSRYWRITAPMRLTRRVLTPTLRAQALPGHVAAPAAPTPPQDPKERARRIFHRTMRAALQLPGSRKGAQLVRRVAPAPVEWLALRYRAYEQRAAAPPPPALPTPAVTVSELTHSLAPEQMAPLDLSADEARLYRRFATSSIAGLVAR